MKLHTECPNKRSGILSAAFAFIIIAPLLYGMLALIWDSMGWFGRIFCIAFPLVVIGLVEAHFAGNYVMIGDTDVCIYRYFRCVKKLSRSSIVAVKYHKPHTYVRTQTMKPTVKFGVLGVYNADGYALFRVCDDEIAREYFRKELHIVVDVSAAFFDEDYPE